MMPEFTKNVHPEVLQKQAGSGINWRHIQGSKITKRPSKCQVLSFTVLKKQNKWTELSARARYRE